MPISEAGPTAVGSQLQCAMHFYRHVVFSLVGNFSFRYRQTNRCGLPTSRSLYCSIPVQPRRAVTVPLALPCTAEVRVVAHGGRNCRKLAGGVVGAAQPGIGVVRGDGDTSVPRVARGIHGECRRPDGVDVVRVCEGGRAPSAATSW